MLEEVRALDSNVLDLQSEQDRLKLAAEAAERFGRLVQALKVELQAPKRVRLVDEAVAPRAR